MYINHHTMNKINITIFSRVCVEVNNDVMNLISRDEINILRCIVLKSGVEYVTKDEVVKIVGDWEAIVKAYELFLLIVQNKRLEGDHDVMDAAQDSTPDYEAEPKDMSNCHSSLNFCESDTQIKVPTGSLLDELKHDKGRNRGEELTDAGCSGACGTTDRPIDYKGPDKGRLIQKNISYCDNEAQLKDMSTCHTSSNFCESDTQSQVLTSNSLDKIEHDEERNHNQELTECLGECGTTNTDYGGPIIRQFTPKNISYLSSRTAQKSMNVSPQAATTDLAVQSDVPQDIDLSKPASVRGVHTLITNPTKLLCCEHCTFVSGNKRIFYKHKLTCCKKLDKSSDSVADEKIIITAISRIDRQKWNARNKRCSDTKLRKSTESFLCQICGKSFKHKHTYIEHCNAHSGIKPFICSICSARFTYYKSLSEHKFLHSDRKMFMCDVCEKSFAQSSVLSAHMKIHKNNKEFRCQICSRTFTQKHSMLRHERAHTGVKPFGCMQCERKFTDESVLRRHLINVHKLQKWQLGMINKTTTT